jgi:hypothetical protein
MTRENGAMENHVPGVTFLRLAEEAMLLGKQNKEHIREVLTTWSRVLLEKLIVSHLLEKLPAVMERHIRPLKYLPLAPILSQINPYHNLSLCFLR